MDSVLNDLRQAGRSLRRAPGFATAAILTLAIGIGANTAIFSVVDHVIIRPLAYEDPERLYVVHEVIPTLTHITSGVPVSANHFVEWKRTTSSFESMALLQSLSLNLTGHGEPEQILGARASADLFRMLGVPRPARARVSARGGCDRPRSRRRAGRPTVAASIRCRPADRRPNDYAERSALRGRWRAPR